jgi:hypothetical protein
VRFVGTAKGLTRQSDELLSGVGLLVPFEYIAEYDLRSAPRGSVLRKSYRIDAAVAMRDRSRFVSLMNKAVICKV